MLRPMDSFELQPKFFIPKTKKLNFTLPMPPSSLPSCLGRNVKQQKCSYFGFVTDPPDDISCVACLFVIFPKAVQHNLTSFHRGEPCRPASASQRDKFFFFRKRRTKERALRFGRHDILLSCLRCPLGPYGALPGPAGLGGFAIHSATQQHI